MGTVFRNPRSARLRPLLRDAASTQRLIAFQPPTAVSPSSLFQHTHTWPIEVFRWFQQLGPEADQLQLPSRLAPVPATPQN